MLTSSVDVVWRLLLSFLQEFCHCVLVLWRPCLSPHHSAVTWPHHVFCVSVASCRDHLSCRPRSRCHLVSSVFGLSDILPQRVAQILCTRVCAASFFYNGFARFCPRLCGWHFRKQSASQARSFMVFLCSLRGVRWVIEQPLNSYLFHEWGLRSTMRSLSAVRWITAMGAFGGDSVKPLEFWGTLEKYGSCPWSSQRLLRGKDWGPQRPFCLNSRRVA